MAPGRLALVCLGLLGAIIFVHPVAGFDADRDAAVNHNLLVQSARVQAIKYLLDRQPQKAVEVLEARLEHINASQEYLTLLRDAYRAYIKELTASKQASLAQKYQSRLNLLEGVTHLAKPVSEPPGSVGPIVAKITNPALQPLQKSNPAGVKPLPQPKETPKNIQSYLPETAAPTTANLQAANAAAQLKQAQTLLVQAETEFRQKRYTEAWPLYEQAHKLDPKAIDGCKDRWAYCKLHHVLDQINQPRLQGCTWSELEREVQAAVALAPQLDKTGKWLLDKIQGRRGDQAAETPAPTTANVAVAVRHHARSASGWSMAETLRFRVFHNQTPELAEKVARVAEETHVAMYRKWFGKEGADWDPKCDLYLHATAQDYSRATGVPTTSPGHSRIETDASASRVVSRRIDLHLENPTMLQCVLPHETTHVVLAGQFGNFQVPRWVDEGIAVLTEPADKVDQHRRNLTRCQRDKELFHVKELMKLTDYPQARRVSAFYAQSVSLVEFLSQQRGPIVFCHFVRDGLREGYDSALRKHYRIQDTSDLQDRWQQHVAADLNRTSNNYAGR